MKHMVIENSGRAVVDFLQCSSHRGTQVVLEVADGRLQIRVSVAHSEDAYTWDEHEYEIDIAPNDDGDRCRAGSCVSFGSREGFEA